MTSFSPTTCINVAKNDRKLRVRCTQCQDITDIDVVITPNLPECPHCGATDWQYCKLAIDVLRYVHKLF